MTISELTPKPQTEARANAIAEALNHRPQMLAFDFGAIVLIVIKLLPYIIDCFDPDDGPQAVAYVEQRWNEEDKDNDYRGYDKRLLKAVTRRAKFAARRSQQRVTWTQAREIAFVTLDNIREGDPQQASVAIAENHNFAA